MKKMRWLSGLLALVMLAAAFIVPSAAAGLPFEDVPEDSWYYSYVSYAYENKLFNGTSDKTFEPQTAMTRAMFVRLMANYDGVDLSEGYTTSPFNDVEEDSWYFSAVSWAAENHVVSGTSATTFNPNDAITREQMCLLLLNYAEYAEITFEEKAETVTFSDEAEISSWAAAAVEVCQKAGIVSGKGDGRFDPKGTASRAEVATLLTNFHMDYADNEEPGEAIIPLDEVLENITPMETTITIPGLTNEYTFLHVTDLHMCAMVPEDEPLVKSRYEVAQQREAAFTVDGMKSADRLPYFMSYAQHIQADKILMTGDIIDFPSKTNLELLKQAIAGSKIPTSYILGNHDWVYADLQMGEGTRDMYGPKFLDISDGNIDMHYDEYEDLIVLAIDNSTDRISSEQLALTEELMAKGKPMLIMMHVPMYSPTLSEDVKKAWSDRDITLGGEGIVHDSNADAFIEMISAENSPVEGLIVGHVHFDHEDLVGGSVKQYITGAAYEGDCRVIRVTGETASE